MQILTSLPGAWSATLEQDPEISPSSTAQTPTPHPGLEKSSSEQGSHSVFSAGGGDPGHINTWGQFSKLPLLVISLWKEVEYLSTAGLGASPFPGAVAPALLTFWERGWLTSVHFPPCSCLPLMILAFPFTEVCFFFFFFLVGGSGYIKDFKSRKMYHVGESFLKKEFS